MKLVEMLSAVEVKGLEVVRDNAQAVIDANPFADIEATFLAMDAINNAIEVKEVAVEEVEITVEEETVEMVKAEVKKVNKTKKVKKEKVKVMRNEERIIKFFEMVEKMAQRSAVIDAAQKEAKKLFNAVPFEFFIKSMEQLAKSKEEYKAMEGFVMKKIERSSVIQATDRGVVRISTSKQLANTMNKIMFNGDVPYFNKINVSVDLDENGKGQTMVNAVPATNSRFAVMFDYMEKTMQIDLDGYKVKVGGDTGNYVTTDVVYVSCKDCGDDMITVIEQVKKYGLYKLGKEIFFPSYVGNTLEIRQGSPRGEKVAYSIVNGDVVIGNKIPTHYTFFNASPSQERVGDFMCIDETKYGLDSRIAQATKVNKFTILDSILGGALSYAISKENMDLGKALKIGTRIALHNTAAVELGKVGNDKYGVMYIDGTIEGSNDYTQDMIDLLDDLGVEIDEAIVDGQGWILADMMVDYFRQANIEVKYEAIKGSGFQMRTEGINDKVFNLAINKKERDILVKNFKANYDCVIVGNPDNIAYIIDANGAKLPNMWRFDEVEALAHGVEYGNFTMNILAVANDSKANSSIQAIGKVVNDTVIDALSDNQYNMLVNSLERITSGSMSMDGKCARAQKLFAANKERSMHSHVAHKMLLGELSDQAITATKKVKVPVDGLNLRAFFDNTFLYTGNEQSVFKVREGGVIEAYSKSAVKMYRKELKAIQAEYLTEVAAIEKDLKAGAITLEMAVQKKAVAKVNRTNAVDELLRAFTVKYPCPTDIEFAKFRYLADFEVEEAIDALNTDKKTKEALRSMILGLNDGIVMIAPLNTLKHKLAGMDTDFDGITSFFEKAIVESAFAKTFNDVVYIDKDGSKSVFNPNYVAPQTSQEALADSVEF